jgi:hypothetical protein
MTKALHYIVAASAGLLVVLYLFGLLPEATGRETFLRLVVVFYSLLAALEIES